MLSKEARKYLGRAVIAVELGCLIGAYRVWHMMNISQGKRQGFHGFGIVLKHRHSIKFKTICWIFKDLFKQIQGLKNLRSFIILHTCNTKQTSIGVWGGGGGGSCPLPSLVRNIN